MVETKDTHFGRNTTLRTSPMLGDVGCLSVCIPYGVFTPSLCKLGVREFFGRCWVFGSAHTVRWKCFDFENTFSINLYINVYIVFIL